MTDLFGDEIVDSGKARSNDWRGFGNNKAGRSIGSSAFSLTPRAENDFYATPPHAVEMLLGIEEFSHKILEPCCGLGHIADVLKRHGHEVECRDLVDRGYGIGGMDFLECKDRDLDCDIITNPPYCKAKEFVEKSMDVIGEGHKVAMFLKLTFLEGKGRREMFERYPPKRVWVSTSRLSCGKNGVDWQPSVLAYMWIVFQKGFHGETTLKWFN